MKIENLSMDEIFIKDDRFRISYFFSLEKLLLSLKEAGLLNYPLVTFRDGRFILVSGWKRVLACLELNFSSLPVFVTEEKDDLRTFLMAFYENLATRQFSLIEKAEVLSRLRRFGEDEKKIVRHYLPLLNIPPTLPHFDSFLAFSQFEPAVKGVIHEKNMPFSLAALLADFSPEERQLLLPLILPLSQNKKLEILENLKEVSKRDDITVEDILSLKEIHDILDSERLSPLQKADGVRLLLKRWRYPLLSSWEESFDSLLKRMRLPKGISIRPSPFFEERSLSVTFSFENREKFEANLLQFRELASREEFSELFKFK